MVTYDIRKLQILNELIEQTLEALDRRAALASTGFGYSPYSQFAFPHGPHPASLIGAAAGYPQTAGFGITGMGPTGYSYGGLGTNHIAGVGAPLFNGVGNGSPFGVGTWPVQPVGIFGGSTRVAGW